MAEILGVRFDLVDYGAVLEAVEAWRAAGKHRYITITPPHSVLLCRRNPDMRDATAGAALTLPDGVGILWACRILGFPNRGRVTGPELMLRLCDQGRARGFRHFFYGGAEGVADTLVGRLTERFPGLQVAGTYSPPFKAVVEAEDAREVDLINAARPDILWVGLGAPKQEVWMARHLGRVEAAAMIGVGAAFDYHSGRVRWAPQWMRRAGLEWAYRLAHEPRRLWRRNLDSPLFLAKVIGQRMKKVQARAPVPPK